MMYRRIKEMREDSDFTQKDVAAYLQVSRTAYSGYENGHRGVPTEVLCLLADFYGTSVDYLLGRTDERKPYPPVSR